HCRHPRIRLHLLEAEQPHREGKSPPKAEGFFLCAKLTYGEGLPFGEPAGGQRARTRSARNSPMSEKTTYSGRPKVKVPMRRRTSGSMRILNSSNSAFSSSVSLMMLHS